MMNTKEDGRCHSTRATLSLLCAPVCLVLHCVGYSTERDVCTSKGERKEEKNRDPFFLAISVPYAFTRMSFVAQRKKPSSFGPILYHPSSFVPPFYISKIGASNIRKDVGPLDVKSYTRHIRDFFSLFCCRTQEESRSFFCFISGTHLYVRHLGTCQITKMIIRAELYFPVINVGCFITCWRRGRRMCLIQTNSLAESIGR